MEKIATRNPPALVKQCIVNTYIIPKLQHQLFNVPLTSLQKAKVSQPVKAFVFGSAHKVSDVSAKLPVQQGGIGLNCNPERQQAFIKRQHWVLESQFKEILEGSSIAQLSLEMAQSPE